MKLEILLPKSVINCTLVPTQGKYTFDNTTKILFWDCGKIDIQKLPNLRGSIAVSAGATAESNPSINVHFTISQLAVSGLKVNRLDMYGEDVKYKPFKGELEGSWGCLKNNFQCLKFETQFTDNHNPKRFCATNKVS